MTEEPNFEQQMYEESDICTKALQQSLKEGWNEVQEHCRPDQSFRAMLRIMIKWMAYLESKEKKKQCDDNIWDILKARGLDHTKAFPLQVISRLEDIGRAQQLLKVILNNEIFDNISKHNPYWHSEHAPECEKLDDLRRKISCISDNLWDLWAILRKEEE